MLLEQWDHTVAKDLVYCYLIGLGLNSCLSGQVSGLLFCLYEKLFLPSVFNSVDFSSSLSCIVLDIELADINVIKELGVFIDGNVQGYSFRPPRNYKPTKQAVWCTKDLYGIEWNSGRLNYTELHKILRSDGKGDFFFKRNRKMPDFWQFIG